MNCRGQARLIEIILAVTILFAFLVVAARSNPTTFMAYSPYYAEESSLQDLADKIMGELDSSGMLEEAARSGKVEDVLTYIRSSLPLGIYFNFTTYQYEHYGNQVVASVVEEMSYNDPNVSGSDYISAKSTKIVDLGSQDGSELTSYLFELVLYEVISY